MSGEHSGNARDLPPLDYFPPTPDREIPIDLKDRAEWLEMEMAKVRREMANLQASTTSTDRRPHDSDRPPYSVYQEGAATPKYPTMPPNNPQSASLPYQHLPELLNLCMGMPQRKVPKFDGNPLNYWKFLRGFTSGVAQYVTDPANRLAFLIDACEGEAREAIDHCTILEPEHGYSEAWRILARRFGNPSVIAREHISSITTGPPIKLNDASSLLKLADKMKACWLVLSQLNYSSELNTRSTMGAILSRLPATIQSQWFDRASEILRKNREPSFVDLTDYVQDRADSLSVRESYLPSASPPSTSRSERPRSLATTPPPKLSTFATTAAANKSSGRVHGAMPTCPCLHCGERHYLDQCARFVRLDADARTTFVRSAALCELCLKPRHNAKQCRSRQCCGLNGCEGLHHPLLHLPARPSTKTATTACQEECRSGLSVNCSRRSCSRASVALGVLPVTLRGPHGVCRVNALLDSGSDSTLLKEDVAVSLGLSGLPANISLATLNGQNEVLTNQVIFDVDMTSPPGTRQSVKAWTVRHLPSITQTLPTREQWSKWDHLKGIPFQTAGGRPISLLIGMDVPMAHWVLESRTGRPHEPYANRTPLGWVLFGPLNDKNGRLARINQLTSYVKDSLDSKLEATINVEFRDSPSYKRSASQADEKALSVAESSLKMTDGRCEMALPWRTGCPSLPSNYLVACQRFNSLGKRISKDRHLDNLHVTPINECLVQGFAEPVNQHAETESTEQVRYLPNHPVVHPHKSSKHSHMVTADLKSMFHQVEVPESHGGVLRFSWREHGDVKKASKTYRMTVHPFGATSSPSYASFALRHAIRNHTMSNDAELLAAERTLYVDDLLLSATSPERLATVAFNPKVALAARGFRITKWSSNEAVLYLRLRHESYRKCYYVWGKPSNTPLKTVTIPRLELTAALLSARKPRKQEKSYPRRLFRPHVGRNVRQLYSLEASDQDGVNFEEQRNRVADQYTGPVSA